MVDLMHLASVETLTWKPPEPSPPVPVAVPASADGLVLQWAGLPLKLAPSSQSADYLVAMHDLVRRIAQLKTDQPEESLALLPLLSSEVQAVIQAQPDWRNRFQADFGNAEQPEIQPEVLQEWQVCTAQWLWWIAQTSHETLRLLEGCAAQISSAGQSESGVLRLVVGLSLNPENPPAHGPELAFDLVTGGPLPPLLPTAQQIQIEESLIGQPIAVGSYLQRLTQQMHSAVPMLQPCFEGQPARWLLPLQPWQSGTLRLRLGLTFSPLSPEESPQSHLPQIGFSQPNWLEQHVSIAVAQQLTQMFLHQPPADDSPEAVLDQGCALLEQLQDSLTLASRIFAQQRLALNDLAFRLQWGINRAAYEVMQLTSGLAVRLLQPRQNWQSGRLRLVVSLHVRTPGQIWRFDLAQRSVCGDRGLSSGDAALDSSATHPEQAVTAEALVQTGEHDWCLRPVALGQLEAAFWQQIEQSAPEIALLRSETEVTASTAQHQGELGVLWLEAAFEFLADGSGFWVRDCE